MERHGASNNHASLHLLVENDFHVVAIFPDVFTVNQCISKFLKSGQNKLAPALANDLPTSATLREGSKIN